MGQQLIEPLASPERGFDMRLAFAVTLVFAAAVGGVGCGTKTQTSAPSSEPTAGATQTAPKEKEPPANQPGKGGKIELTMPETVAMAQGSTRDVLILCGSEGYKGLVTVEVIPPKGISVEPRSTDR